jgi:heptosyltransferase-3
VSLALERAPASALVISLRYLGDALLATPVVHALKQRWPQCAVDMLVFDSARPILAGNPELRRVITLPERPTRAQTFALMRALWRRYDLALATQSGTRPALFAWAAGRQRLGFLPPEAGKAWWKRALFDAVPAGPAPAAVVLDAMRLPALLGIEAAPVVVPPRAPDGRAAVLAACAVDIEGAAYAVIHPAPRFRYKQWTRAGWLAVIQALRARGLRVLVTGGPAPEEAHYLDQLLAGLGDDEVQRIDGRLDFAATAALLARARVFVGVDTATTHLAAACGAPTVAIFGPTDPAIWGPWPARDGAAYASRGALQARGQVILLQNDALPCVPCQQEGCDRHRASRAQCLDELPAAPVLAAIEALAGRA